MSERYINNLTGDFSICFSEHLTEHPNKLISQTPQINATQMSENMGISLRQVQRYLKQLSDLNLIVREGGRKKGIWKIVDEEYEGFFNRI